MLDPQTLARPYAMACFQYAQEEQKLEDWLMFLQVSAAMVAEPGLKGWFESPVIASKRRAFWETLLSKEGSVGQFNFIELLAEKKRLLLIPSILAEFEKMKLEYESCCRVEVTSVTLLKEDEISRFSEALSKRLGLKVTMSNKQDPSILGGAIIQSGDFVMDHSVKGKLKQLAEHLLEPA